MAEFVKVANIAEVPPGTAKLVFVDNVPLALYNVAGQIYATDDTCTHEEASLAEGELTEHVIKCPRHGAEFDVRTGQQLCMPAVAPVATYAVKVEGAVILVSLGSRG